MSFFILTHGPSAHARVWPNFLVGSDGGIDDFHRDNGNQRNGRRGTCVPAGAG
jgi:hypothetical protein